MRNPPPEAVSLLMGRLIRKDRSNMIRRLIVLPVLGILAACTSTPVNHTGNGVPRTATIVPLESGQPLVALVLGSGGARGFAHVGVIAALEEAGIVPDIIAGASSGAVVAAIYAAGYRADELREIALSTDQATLVDFSLFGGGWVRGEALQAFVNRIVDNRPLERLARPFAVVATRARDGRMTVFNRGETGLAVRASASVPNLFVPPVIEGEEYLDGGLSSPVPVAVAREMGADIVIAVDVSWFAQARHNGIDTPPSRSLRRQLLERELGKADIVIAPRTAPTRILDFDNKPENIAAGEAAAREVLPQLKELIVRVAAEKRRLARADVEPLAARVE
jgi:NTE family protein